MQMSFSLWGSLPWIKIGSDGNRCCSSWWQWCQWYVSDAFFLFFSKKMSQFCVDSWFPILFGKEECRFWPLAFWPKLTSGSKRDTLLNFARKSRELHLARSWRHPRTMSAAVESQILDVVVEFAFSLCCSFGVSLFSELSLHLFHSFLFIVKKTATRSFLLSISRQSLYYSSPFANTLTKFTS